MATSFENYWPKKYMSRAKCFISRDIIVSEHLASFLFKNVELLNSTRATQSEFFHYCVRYIGRAIIFAIKIRFKFFYTAYI